MKPFFQGQNKKLRNQANFEGLVFQAGISMRKQAGNAHFGRLAET
jgi:hypothetical protein